jgi:hypothetical protein
MTAPLRRGYFARRVLFPALRIGLGLAFVGLGLGVLLARRAQPDYRPVQAQVSSEQRALMDRTPLYRRPQEATYLTYPEWYLVFNPQEYARSLATHPASAFPYFRSIAQLWYAYAQVYGLTRRFYPFDFGDHLMVMVIGTSTTVEYTIKGVYERSVGRLAEWSAFGVRTAEEDYAAKVAQDYGDFVPIDPWFEFPFAHALAGLWSGNPFFGPAFGRKCERKFFLSLEYGAKALYAAVIRVASHAVYGVADTRVYATVKGLPDSALQDGSVQKIQALGGGSWVITVPHYQGFTDTVPKLAAEGVEFQEIAGNGEILLSLVAPRDWTFDLAAGRPLFSLETLDGPGRKRVAIQAPVIDLSRMLRQIKAENLTLEHLYDY